MMDRSRLAGAAGLVPDEGFVDTHHTNELGAAIVSRELVARVLGVRFAVGRERDGDRR
jgi:hypothetical protein